MEKQAFTHGKRSRIIYGKPIVPRRAAFTVVEVVIAVAMIAILAALTLPTVAEYQSNKKIEETADILTDLKNSIQNFRYYVGNSPGRLTHLTRQITSGVGGDLTSCTGIGNAIPATTYTTTNTGKWPQGAPYYPKQLSANGLPVPIGIISDTLFRNAIAGNTSFLSITIRNARYQDARGLNDLMDGPKDTDQSNRSNTTGVLQWGVPNSAERVDISYRVSIGSAC